MFGFLRGSSKIICVNMGCKFPPIVTCPKAPSARVEWVRAARRAEPFPRPHAQ